MLKYLTNNSHLFLALSILIIISIIIKCSHCHELVVVNKCPVELWIGMLGNFEQEHPENGGFSLAGGGDSKTIAVPHGWGGRIWGRTHCDSETGTCETGDCGSVLECGGAGGIPPFTIVDIIFDGLGEVDYYYVSLTDGYNLGVQVEAIPGTIEGDCAIAGCLNNMDLNRFCPPELSKFSSPVGPRRLIACSSPCQIFNTDEYCCRGAFDSPTTCLPSAWPVDYSAVFKLACPAAFTYKYDSSQNNFVCESKEEDSSSYQITFCPTSTSL